MPTLRPRDVVVLDNLALHKQPEIVTVTEAAGAQVRFLPPYSPDFNPECANYIRHAGQRVATSLWKRSKFC